MQMSGNVNVELCLTVPANQPMTRGSKFVQIKKKARGRESRAQIRLIACYR
jgi:hypothetical protein